MGSGSQSDAASSTAASSLELKGKQLVENGIEASIVGKRLVEALNAGEMYIFTHANYRPAIQQRFSAIDAAFDSAAQSPLLQNIVN